MSDVTVHRDSASPAAHGALAYAQGTEIHLASGQEQHLPHEAWHVVQQKQGRVAPSIQRKGAALNTDPALEQEADIMGARAMEASSSTASRPPGVASLPGAPIVQRVEIGGALSLGPEDLALLYLALTRLLPALGRLLVDQVAAILSPQPEVKQAIQRASKAEAPAREEKLEAEIQPQVQEAVAQIAPARSQGDAAPRDAVDPSPPQIPAPTLSPAQQLQAALRDRFAGIPHLISRANADKIHRSEVLEREWIYANAKSQDSALDLGLMQRIVGDLDQIEVEICGALRLLSGKEEKKQPRKKGTQAAPDQGAAAFDHEDADTWAVQPIETLLSGKTVQGIMAQNAQIWRRIARCAQPGQHSGVKYKVNTRYHVHLVGGEGLSFVYRSDGGGRVTPLVYDYAPARDDQWKYEWSRGPKDSGPSAAPTS